MSDHLSGLGIEYPVTAGRTYWLPTQITRQIKLMLERCTTANGFVTNLGARVEIARGKAGSEEAPAAFVIPGRQSGEPLYDDAVEQVRAYEITAIADTHDHPDIDDYELVDRLIWDVRRCLETRDEALAELVDSIKYTSDRPGYREDGGTIVGASITYEVRYTLQIHTPASAF